MKFLKRLLGGKEESPPNQTTAGAIESILIVEDAKLYAAIRNASDAPRHRAVEAVTRYAVSCVGLKRPEIDEALSCLGAGARPNAALVSVIGRLVEDLDEEDWQLQEMEQNSQEPQQ